MDLVQLTSDYEMKPFDCGDTELNGFLLAEAKPFAEKHLASTYLLCDGNTIAGFFSLFNDKISKLEVSKATWRKIKRPFPHSKHFGSYPAVKVGRFAISVHYRSQGLGSELLYVLKRMLGQAQRLSSFRFLTVDAYLDAVLFYERNGFQRLALLEEPSHTQAMFFDMQQLF